LPLKKDVRQFDIVPPFKKKYIYIVLMYKDYFEGDKEAEIELVEALYKAKPSAFVPIYRNYAA